ncbi:MAG: FxsA family protein [Planctomycetaceae bacterium]|nr:FxsA family protein [Planctomycetaceae bacterium]
MSARFLVVITCLLLAADLLLLAPLCVVLGWRFLAMQGIVTAGIGILVIGYYEWRWAGAIAERLGGESPEPLNSCCLEKVFLVLAAALLILPGALTDVLGLALLTPPIRRLAAHALPRCQAAPAAD